jgi:hypothetical protein
MTPIILFVLGFAMTNAETKELTQKPENDYHNWRKQQSPAKQ